MSDDLDLAVALWHGGAFPDETFEQRAPWWSTYDEVAS